MGRSRSLPSPHFIFNFKSTIKINSISRIFIHKILLNNWSLWNISQNISFPWLWGPAWSEPFPPPVLYYTQPDSSLKNTYFLWPGPLQWLPTDVIVDKVLTCKAPQKPSTYYSCLLSYHFFFCSFFPIMLDFFQVWKCTFSLLPSRLYMSVPSDLNTHPPQL